MRTIFTVMDMGHGSPRNMGTFIDHYDALDRVIELLLEKGTRWDLKVVQINLPN